MATETILQNWIFTEFAYPFLLIFLISFGLLAKTKLFGENKQLDSIVSFVIALIFVSAAKPKIIAGNMILFLTVAMVVMFVGLLLWGFVTGGEAKVGEKAAKPFAALIIVAVILALFWATGIQDVVISLLFQQSWSSSFWTNFLFIAVVAVALALAMKKSGVAKKE